MLKAIFCFTLPLLVALDSWADSNSFETDQGRGSTAGSFETLQGRERASTDLEQIPETGDSDASLSLEPELGDVEKSQVEVPPAIEIQAGAQSSGPLRCPNKTSSTREKLRLNLIVEGQPVYTYALLSFRICPIHRNLASLVNSTQDGDWKSFQNLMSAIRSQKFEKVAQFSVARDQKKFKAFAQDLFVKFKKASNLIAEKRIDFAKDQVVYVVKAKVDKKVERFFFPFKIVVGQWLYAFRDSAAMGKYFDFIQEIESHRKLFPEFRADRLTHKLSFGDNNWLNFQLDFSYWDKSTDVVKEFQSIYDKLGKAMDNRSLDEVKVFMGPKSWRYFEHWHSRDDFWKSYQHVLSDRRVVGALDMFPVYLVYTNGKKGEGVYANWFDKNSKNKYKLANLGDKYFIESLIKKPLDKALRQGKPFSSLKSK